MKKLSRILILGNAGTGKNYRGERLSKAIRIPFYDIDDIIFKEKFTIIRSKPQRSRLARTLAKKRRWICGAFPSAWNSSLAQSSQKIIILTENRIILAYRIITRYFKRKHSQAPEKESLFGLWNLLKFMWHDFRPEGKKGIYFEKIKKKYACKIVLLHAKKEQAAYFAKLAEECKK